ncbi:bacteriophage holin [Actinokineospora sp. NPDC004072]
MPFLLSALIAVGLVCLAVAAISVLRRAGRTRTAVDAARAGLADRSGLVRARTAALRVAIEDRKSAVRRVGSIQRGETGGRP